MLRRLRRDRANTDERASQDDRLLVVGLGNPGRRYQGTRHNAGFMVLDRVYDRLPPGTTRSRFQADLVETTYAGRRVVLAKPTTFMNESGVAVGQIARWYGIPVERILIVYDELDLPFGTIRMRAGGSAGGHNGLASIIAHLRTQDVARLRVGISRPRSGSTVPYVLAPFNDRERQELPAILDRAADAVLAWIDRGVTAAMNEFNRKPDAPAGS